MHQSKRMRARGTVRQLPLSPHALAQQGERSAGGACRGACVARALSEGVQALSKGDGGGAEGGLEL